MTKNPNFIPRLAEPVVLEKFDVDKAIQDIEKVLNVPAVSSELPLQVTKFCEDISKNFEATAAALEATAERMEMVTRDLRDRAERLRNAAPEVRADVERWIGFERESNSKGRYFEPLFKPRHD